MAYLEYFPEAFIALNKEVIYHPRLMAILAKHPEAEFELKLAEIAAYCFIEVDGEFTQDDLVKLADLCLERLKALHGVRPLDQAPREKVKDPLGQEDWSKLLLPQSTKQ